MPSVKCALVRRDGIPGDANASSALTSTNMGIMIAGVTLCALIVLGVAVWLIVRMIRKKSQQKREDERGAAFLTVRGIVRDDGAPIDPPAMEKVPPNSDGVRGMAFSRNQLTPAVVMPDKILPPKLTVNRDEIIETHRQSGTLPKPFSFALNASSHATRPSVDNPRMSYLSVSSNHSGRRFSVVSTSSAASSISSGNTRKVRQEFEPVLPDELLVSAGERLTVIDSFDDGWCLVGRENSVFAASAKTLFGSTKDESNIELGVVPAWCFIQSVKGLRAERPVRSSSLGITVQLDSNPTSARNDVMSWSNF